MAIDFNPMLARNLAKEAMATQGMYGLGQTLGSPEAISGLLKMFSKDKDLEATPEKEGGALPEEPKPEESKPEDKKEPKKSFLDFLKQSMTDDKGLFRGGMNDRAFGRLRDETDILKSRAKGAIRNLPSQVKGALSQFPLQGKGQNITMYKNGQIVPREPVAPTNVPNMETPQQPNVGGLEDLTDKYTQSYDPMQIPIPKYNIEDMNTYAQDELIDYNVSGGNTLGGVNVGDAQGLTDNVYNYDFTTDLMYTPKKVDNKYSVEGFKNAVNFNKGLGYLDEYVNPVSRTSLDRQIDDINAMALNILPTTRTPYAVGAGLNYALKSPTFLGGIRNLLNYAKGSQVNIPTPPNAAAAGLINSLK